MSEPIIIMWTAGAIDEARRIARELVAEGSVACANIIPWVESIYMWNNQLNTEQESKVLLKTTRDKWDRVSQVIRERCSYEVPEITAIAYAEMDPGYREWINASLGAQQH